MAIATVSLFWASAGCLSFSSHDWGLTVSPDATYAAYINSESVGFGIVCAGMALGGKSHVRICRMDHARNVKSIKIDEYAGDPPFGYIDGMLPIIKFSPDSRRLAALAGGVLSCIDVNTSRMWPLAPSDERVTTFSWIGPGEIAYVGHSNDRKFFRHKVDTPPCKRKVIHVGAGPAKQGFCFPYEYWSPHGQFVIYKRLNGGFALLTVKTGAVRLFDAPSAVAMQVAWKTDESAVLCVSYDKRYSPVATVLIDMGTGESLDLSQQFFEAVTDPWRKELEPDWTADGKFFIVNTFRRGGILIQPKLWKVIPIGERLVRDIGHRYRFDRYSDPSLNPPPSAHAFPVAGWIKVIADGKEYAVDYALQNFLELGWSDSGLLRIVVLPEGDRTVEIAPFGGTMIRNIDLGASKPLGGTGNSSSTIQSARDPARFARTP